MESRTSRVPEDPRDRFIAVLAEFLVEGQAMKSIALQMEDKHPPIVPWASQWAKLRDSTPLFGYPTKAEAVETLIKFIKRI